MTIHWRDAIVLADILTREDWPADDWVETYENANYPFPEDGPEPVTLDDAIIGWTCHPGTPTTFDGVLATLRATWGMFAMMATAGHDWHVAAMGQAPLPFGTVGA